MCAVHYYFVDMQYALNISGCAIYNNFLLGSVIPIHDIISTKRYYAFMQYALRVSGWGSSPAIVEPGYDNSTK